MADFNQITLSGRLTRDIELRTMKNGKNVALGSIAYNEPKPTPDGNWENHADFFEFVAFDTNTYEFAKKMASEIRKGEPVVISGKVSQRKYQNKEGQTVSVFEIIVRQFRKLAVPAKKPDTGFSNQTQDWSAAGTREQHQANLANANVPQTTNQAPLDPFADSGNTLDISDDDLPF